MSTPHGFIRIKMLVDGVLKSVPIKRNSPTDKLVAMYTQTAIWADISETYARYAVYGKEALEMSKKCVQAKYPFLERMKASGVEEIEKFNRAMAMAKKHTAKKAENNGR